MSGLLRLQCAYSFGIYKKVFNTQRAWHSPTKNATYYSPRSGFPYYNLTPPIAKCTPIHHIRTHCHLALGTFTKSQFIFRGGKNPNCYHYNCYYCYCYYLYIFSNSILITLSYDIYHNFLLSLSCFFRLR